MEPSALIFDFDYPLADSSNGVVACFNHAFRAQGHPQAEQNAIRDTIGLSFEFAFVELFGKDHSIDLERFKHDFLEHSDDVMIANTQILPDVPETISILADRGYRMGIVSTKHRPPIVSVLEREGIRPCFDIIVGGGEVKTHKPDPEGLLRTICEFKTQPDRVLYVGDSVTDAQTAKNANAPFAAVLTGPTPEANLRPFGPQHVLNEFSQLLDLLP